MERRQGNFSDVRSSGIPRQVLKKFPPAENNEVGIHQIYREGGEVFASVRSTNLEKLIAGGIATMLRDSLNNMEGIEFKNPGIEAKHSPYRIEDGFERVFKVNTGMPDLWDSFQTEHAERVQGVRNTANRNK